MVPFSARCNSIYDNFLFFGFGVPSGMYEIWATVNLVRVFAKARDLNTNWQMYSCQTAYAQMSCVQCDSLVSFYDRHIHNVSIIWNGILCSTEEAWIILTRNFYNLCWHTDNCLLSFYRCRFCIDFNVIHTMCVCGALPMSSSSLGEMFYFSIENRNWFDVMHF